MSQSETNRSPPNDHELVISSPTPVSGRQAGSHSGLDAQRLGQTVSRRGLRGGRPVLEAARAAYLSTQWSGDHDRRPEPGLLTRTRI